VSVIRIEVAHPLAIGLREGFDYMTDPANWPEYWPGLVRVEPGSQWSAPGDRARLVLRLLGRPTEMTMTLGRIAPYRLVEYTSTQRGLPDARHERHFADDGRGGLAYRLVVELSPRPGLRGLFDRVLVPRAVRRALRETVTNLEGRFRAATVAPGAG
jgi:Polyketide cyclase / dehydrase and lipid transport